MGPDNQYSPSKVVLIALAVGCSVSMLLGAGCSVALDWHIKNVRIKETGTAVEPTKTRYVGVSKNVI